jgi:hypothetical protein
MRRFEVLAQMVVPHRARRLDPAPGTPPARAGNQTTTKAEVMFTYGKRKPTPR